MPVPIPAVPVDGLPTLTRDDIDACRTSSWPASLRQHAVPAEIINLDVLGERAEFLEWLASDSIIMPGVEIDADSDASDADEPRTYYLPKLTAAIIRIIKQFGGSVFPKLNWTAPMDAAFILPQTNGPLRCYTADDVYLLLKSSDIIQHDLDPSRVCGEPTKIELVLKAFIDINPSREVRCFVRNNVLVGISQRDSNYYPHLEVKGISDAVRDFWEDELIDFGSDYVFDLLLPSTLIDINPYRESTSPVLFTYPELAQLLGSQQRLPIVRVVESQAEANAQSSIHSTNRVPIEMVELSQGRSTAEFAQVWQEALASGMRD